MSKTVIKIEQLYKEYRLGVIGHGTLYRDLQSWWANLRGKEDPNTLIGLSGRAAVTNNILALNDINLDVKEGDVLGIIGANGAGKSTLLKILSRVTAPSKGTIKVKGRIASLLEVGTGFHPELTGRENIYLNGTINGMNKPEVARKLDEIANFAGVEKFLDTPVKRYSSGMHVRLGFAVAAHLDPDILVVDEVLAVGDAEFQKKAIKKMKDVTRSEGRTVLFVSHSMKSIMELCPSSVLLEKGTIAFQGASVDTINDYHQRIRNFQIERDLSSEDFTSRPGNGKARFKKIEILNDDGEKKECFKIGNKVIFKIEYRTYSDLDNLIVSIFLKSSSTVENVAIVKNYITKKKLNRNQSGLVKISINTQSLNTREYSLGFLLLEEGIKSQCDYVENVVSNLCMIPSANQVNDDGWGLPNQGLMRIKSSIISL